MDLHALTALVAAARDGGDAAAAVAACRRAEAAHPGDARIKRLLFVALLAAAGRRDDGPLDQSGLDAAEDVGIAEAELLHGRFADGWRRYERRLDDPSYARMRVAADLRQVEADGVLRWRGEPLPAGSTILCIAEQGLGDIFQFLRHVPLLAARCPGTTLMVPPNLVAFVRAQPSLAGIPVVAPGQPMAKPDRFVMLMSLPHLLGRPEPWVPDEPYLIAGQFPAPRLAGWRPGGIGIAWRGSGALSGRDLPLEPLAAVLAGRRVVSLQMGVRADEAALLDRAGIARIHGLDDNGPHAFLDTAPLLARLGLVIACDTGVAHLAAAMGRPTWLLLPWNGDWRWMVGRTDSPWYPSVRLFRQPRMGDWDPVFAAVAAALVDQAGALSTIQIAAGSRTEAPEA